MREEEEEDCADAAEAAAAAAAAQASPSDSADHRSPPAHLPSVVEDSETEDQAAEVSSSSSLPSMAVHAAIPSVVADSEEDEDEDEDARRRRAIAISHALQQERGSCSRQAEKDGRLPAFMTARALLAENIWGKEVFLSPGFRSVAALAGWDDESLLIATVEGSNGLMPAHEKPAAAGSPVVCQSPQPSATRMRTRDRKREERTPQQAATPLSAGRRHRRARRQAIHGCSPEALPIGDLSLNEEFQREVNGPCAENRVEVQEVERDDTASSLQAQAEAVLPTVADNEGRSSDPMAAIDKGPSTEDDFKNHLSTGLHQSQEEFPALDDKGASIEADSKDQKLSCLDQLRDELSCAVCLDICFEPSTTSCGHSFCRGCLRSVLEKCGPRCPKCRQQLKGDTWRSCPVNVVLWNTVQLLFPTETESRAVAAKEAEKKKQAEGLACGSRKESATAAATRAAREAWQSARPPPAGLRRRGDRWGFIRQGPVMVGGHWSAGEEDDDAEVVVARPRSQSSHGSSSSRRRRQEQADAALARRLQQAELAHAQAGSSNAPSAVTATTTTIASAAANLRTVAYRAVRHQSFRSRH